MFEGAALEGSTCVGVASGVYMFFCDVGLLERMGITSMLVSDEKVSVTFLTFVGGDWLRGLVVVCSGITVVVGIVVVGFIDGLRSTTSFSVSVTFVCVGGLMGLVVVCSGITAFVLVVVVGFMAIGFIDGLRSTTSSSISLFSLLALLLKNFSLNPEGMTSLCSSFNSEG